jgi:hypothetical protein
MATTARMLAEISGLHLKRTTTTAMTRAAGNSSENWFYQIACREEKLSNENPDEIAPGEVGL